MQVFRLEGFTSERGFAFTAPTPEHARALADGTRCFLIEDGKMLGPAESPHDTIRKAGRGAFSVWGPQVYLSASDNTDPNENGRQYLLIAESIGRESQMGSLLRGFLAADDLSILELVNANARINNTVFSNFFRYKDTITQPLKQRGIGLPRSILEVGCGKTPYTALRFLADGVERYIANDIAKVDVEFDRPLIAELLTCLNIIDADLGSRLSNTLTTDYLAKGLTVIGETPCEEIELQEPVEFITSTSVLEHVTKPSAVVAAFHRLLADGGTMWHSIDLRDHRDFSHPFNFLYKSNGDYKEQTENRLRWSDWLGLFRNSGFEIVETRYLVQQPDNQSVWTASQGAVEPVFSERHRALFAPPFDRYELDDLSTLAVQVLCRRR